ncbi:MAG: YbaB/EbfC family nucleoid-associated protein [Candidatus Krumholzibacteria bacterium]|jgi:DNA-binding YbaB/EbfC family protein|nr:YbaB/EbfC family nucleoid-associated protein [Candidatus Krumholzibacteria bacterium]
MKDLGKLMKQAQQVQERLAEMQARLAEKTVEATAGGGMVKVVMNGKHELVSLKIDPEVVNPSDVEMLEDLIIAALNEARTRVDDMVRNEMSTLTGGLPIPGLF